MSVVRVTGRDWVEMMVWPRPLARVVPHVRLGVAWGIGIFAAMWIAARMAWGVVVGTAGSRASSAGLTWVEVVAEALFGMAIPCFVTCLSLLGLASVVVPAIRQQDKYAGLAGRLRWRVMLMAPACAVVPGTVLAVLVCLAADALSGPGLSRGAPAAMRSPGFAIAVAVLAASYLVIFANGLRLAWKEARVEAARGAGDGTCRECGYSLAGLEDRRCPECGQAIEI